MKKKSNALLMVLSALVAVLLWGYVITQVNPTVKRTISGVPVQLMNADTLANEGLVMTTTELTVTAVLRGDRTTVYSIQPEEVFAFVNVASCTEGSNVVPVNLSIPASVEVKEARPADVNIFVERLVSRQVPVELEYSGTLPVGYEVGFVKMNPETVTVSGRESSVSKVSTARIALDLAKITNKGFTFEITPTALNSTRTEVGGVTVSEAVTGQAYLCETKEIPLVPQVTAAEAEEGYVLRIDAPATIKVRSASYNLNQLTEVTTEEERVAYSATAKGVVLKPVLPAGVEPADGYETVFATVHFEPVPVE